LIIFCWSVKAQECVEPYENMIINSDTILCPGTYYLNDTDENGVIFINASDIILDCNGAVFIGNRIPLSRAINNGYYSLGRANVTVKNCTVKDYFIGIRWFNARNDSILNNKVFYGMHVGIKLSKSDNCALINNTAVNTYGGASWPGGWAGPNSGILVFKSNRTSLINNTAVNSTECRGIYLDRSPESMLIDNIARNNDIGFLVFASPGSLINNIAENNIQAGFIVTRCDYLNLIDNTARNNLLGLGIQGNHMTLINNTINLNEGAGIGLISGTRNTSLTGNIIKGIEDELNITHNSTWCTNITFSSNKVNSSSIIPYYFPSGFGIGLEECRNVTITNNEANYNELTGIIILDSQNNLIDSNAISNNDNYGGIFLSSSNNISVSDNNLIDNAYGIYSEYSNYNTLSSNEVSENTYDGVKMDTSDSVDITLNNISFNHIGIHIIDSSDFDIINNTLNHNQQRDILVDPSNDFQIIENKISSSLYGIKLTQTTNANISKNLILGNDNGIEIFSSEGINFDNNTISNSTGEGVKLDCSNQTDILQNIIEFNNIGAHVKDSSDFDIINNTFRNNTQANVIIDPSNDFRLIDNLIFSSNFGLKILNSLGGIILRNLVQYNNYGIHLSSSDIITNNTIISDSVFYDIWLENSNNTLTNTTCDSQKVNITGLSTLPIIWYLDIRALDQDQNPLESASVVGYDNYNTQVFSLSTDANGYIPTQELIEYIQNSTEKIFYSPYTIKVEKEDFITSIWVFNLTESTSLDIILSSAEVFSNIDIDPNIINLKSKGQFVMTFIEVPGYNVSNIDINTVRMNETIPAINDTKYGFVKDPKIEDRDEDGLLEFMAVFNRDLVKTILQVGNNTLTVTGEIEDTYFEGNDTINVKGEK